MITAPCGSWRSPFDLAAVVADSLRLSEPRGDGDDVYWIEGRPQESGRCALVRRRAGGADEELLPPGYSARSRLHEYGGGAYDVHAGDLCFVNDADQCLYRLEPGGPRRLTAPSARRYGDLNFDRPRHRLLCVVEDHHGSGEPRTSLMALDLHGGAAEELASGADFYCSPAASPGGERIAWIAWRHPNMPWDATELWMADLDHSGRTQDARRIAAGASILQPCWHSDGTLYFLSDHDGWWNLYRWNGSEVSAVTRARAELANAQWTLGAPSYALTGDHALCVVARAGSRRLERVALASGEFVSCPLPFTEIDGVRAAGGGAVCCAAAPAQPRCVVELDPDGGRHRILRAAGAPAADVAELSLPQALSFPTGADETAYAYYYAPRNRAWQPPPGERPPLLLKCHGGPTGCASTALDPRVQFWTSRGFALLEVDHRGSTGYGRDYRARLYGQWGVLDVQDCVQGAAFVAREGLVDPARGLISGASAGGYTTLCVLSASRRFRAGTSWYGISDLAALIADSHKFEARYTQRLVGEDPRLWRARSPLHQVAGIDCPVLFLQGLDDRVVPPPQSRQMVTALRARGVPVAHLEFEGEGHGFRGAQTLRRALAAELDFYARVLGFTPADALEPVRIEPALS